MENAAYFPVANQKLEIPPHERMHLDAPVRPVLGVSETDMVRGKIHILHVQRDRLIGPRPYVSEHANNRLESLVIAALQPISLLLFQKDRDLAGRFGLRKFRLDYFVRLAADTMPFSRW
jgi:hypothetical protein